jgi:hypothetical protein
MQRAAISIFALGAALVPATAFAGDGPTSFSGSDLITNDAKKAAEPTNAERDRAQDARLDRLEKAAAERPAEPITAPKGDGTAPSWLSKFSPGGFIQPQLVFFHYNDIASPNADAAGQLPPGVGANDIIARADGTTSNTSAFRIRRSRLKLDFRPNDRLLARIEIEPLTSGGPSARSKTIARNIEVAGTVEWKPGITTTFGAGIIPVPFGYETQQSNGNRPFVDRSFGAQSMMGGSLDTGIYATTRAVDKRLTVTLAVVNGVVLGETNFADVPDLNRSKDLALRANYNFGPVDVGLSGYLGNGQNIDPTLLRAKFFRRYAGNLELGLHHTFAKKLGETRLFAEGVFGENMDRGIFYRFALPEIPPLVASDVVAKNQVSAWVRVEQDLGKYITVGGRIDRYVPDTGVPDSGRTTAGGLVAGHILNGLDVIAEYAFIRDFVHPANTTMLGRQTQVISASSILRF